MIYNLSLFSKSYLQFTNSAGDIITLVANLEFQNRPIANQGDEYDEAEYQEIYQGNLINPSSLPPTLEIGIVGTGNINGVVGRVKLLNVFGSSVSVVASFGQKIRVALIERTQFVNPGGA